MPYGESCREEVAFTKEQIAFALKQAELGTAVGEICRKMGIADATFYVCEEEVRRPGAIGAQAAAPVGKRKPQAETACGRLELGQGDAAGGGHKKTLKAAQKRV